MSSTATGLRGRDAMRQEVRRGLMAKQKELPSKYFYDVRGSELFEEITRLPEYYLTRAERSLLERVVPQLIAAAKPATLVELGPGGGGKNRLLLDAMREQGIEPVYVPVDVSRTYLESIARELADEPVRVVPITADISAQLAVPQGLPAPVLIAFLGSTIGNFDEAGASRLLRRVRHVLVQSGPGGHFLLGADLRKEVRELEAAYNDTRGVTAEFNRNLLAVVNRELGADFDPAAFAHRAFYDPEQHRIEMHLVARTPQTVLIPGVGAFTVQRGESIRTEISCKYDFASLARMLGGARLQIRQWHTEGDRFALALAAPAAAEAE